MLNLIKSIRERDPARPAFLEVFFAYPGFHAIGFHRVGHLLWQMNLRSLARFWSHIGRFFTGIEIHPGAIIGRNLFIDHGMGVVIGETSIIGDNVTMYHGVTLGGKGGREKPVKRHPTIEDNVIIGSGSQLLGDILIGEGAKIGASSIVTGPVPKGCTVVGNPARMVYCAEGDEGKAYGMPRHLVDPVTEVINGLLKDVEELKKKAGVADDEDTDDYRGHWKGGGI